MKTSHYYVRQQGEHVSGPYSIKQLRQLIEDNRLRPDMEFSQDREEWAYGLELVDLFSTEWRSRKIASWYMPAERVLDVKSKLRRLWSRGRVQAPRQPWQPAGTAITSA